MLFSEKLDNLLKEKSNNEEFSGVVLIKKGKDEIFSGAYGYANRSFAIKNNMNTKFRIGSITKMFTATAIMQLIEKGSLSLDTKVVEYLNLEGTKIPHNVTIYHLLTHTSGIADYYDESNSDDGDWEKLWENRPIYNMRELKDYFPLFAFNEPVFKPGYKFSYNGAGYILLGMVIEKATDISYFDYIRDSIFKSLDMFNSDFLSLDIVYENVAEGYEPIKDSDGNILSWTRNIYTATPGAAADGGSSSTAEDLVKYIQGVRDGRLLSKNYTQKLLQPQVLDEKSNGFRGYVWKYGFANYFLIDDAGNIVRGGHTGEEYGVSARLYYYPHQGIDVVILGNQGFCAGALGWQIHDLVIENFQ